MTITAEFMSDLATRYGPAKAATSGRAYRLGQVADAYESAQGEAKVALGDWLIRQAMKLPGWRSPYSFFGRTSSKGLYNVASYHHPARLCWSWCLSLGVGPRHAPWRARPFWRSGYGQTCFVIPGILCLRFSRQTYDWMVSGNLRNMLRFLADAERMNRETASD